jgi:hypothetical protein
MNLRVRKTELVKDETPRFDPILFHFLIEEIRAIRTDPKPVMANYPLLEQFGLDKQSAPSYLMKIKSRYLKKAEEGSGKLKGTN